MSSSQIFLIERDPKIEKHFNLSYKHWVAMETCHHETKGNDMGIFKYFLLNMFV